MGFEIDTIWNGIGDLVPSTADISNTIGDFINTALSNTIGQVLYGIVSLVNWFIAMVYQLFEVFSGQMKVAYNGEYEYLTNVFFENSTITGIYWGMAIIGVVLCFAFTIIAVIRKMFDGSDKMQTSMGAILGSMFKSILLILSLNVALMVVLNFTNVLMQRVVYVFNAGSSLVEEQSIDFTDDQFATMGRVLNTIGNYSLNPSHNSRYNLNSCFNEIRGDMLYLQQQGVFEFYYVTKDADGNEVPTWQSELQKIVFTANLEEELTMDVYNEGVANTLLDIMETLETNTAFYPLKHYERDPIPMNNIPFDRVMFLACTYNAARNEHFNINPSHTDPLRGPYYNGEKSIYDIETVSEDFYLLWGFNYIVFFAVVYGIMKEMIYILLDCIARIYNMLVLYLVGPAFIALSPLDGGGKQKQWMTAFVVQCFGVFGTVIAMRLMLTFAPIIISTELEIFSNAAMDIAAKILMIQAACLACRKANAMFTGILADSAGWQSITAGNLRGDYDAKEKEAEAKKEKKQAAAQSAAKLAAGGGNLQDVKNVGEAVKDQKKESEQKAGLGDGGNENKDSGGTGENTGTENNGTENTGTENKTDEGTPDKLNLGDNPTDNQSNDPQQTNLGTGNNDANNMEGNFAGINTDGIGAIPVPPPINPAVFHSPPPEQQGQQQGQPQDQGDGNRDAPPNRNNGGQ